MNNIKYKFREDKCCGCGACVNICPKNAISYSKNKFEFIIPDINDNLCIECGKCINVCPFNKQKDGNKPIKCYAGMIKNKVIRKDSSSGGIFSSIAEYILDNNGCVVGCTMDEQFQVKHIIIEKKSDLFKIRRSKYVQSYMDDIYKDIITCLEKKKTVLFCGTPCQVVAIKNFVPNKFIHRLITIDVVCHGVPNQQLFNDYLYNLSKKKCLSKYEFRAKKNINNGMNCFFSYKYTRGKIKIKNWPEDSFNYLYMKSLIYRDSCYNCLFAQPKRYSDITLCDYWHWDKYQTKFKDGDTVSGILINDYAGMKLINIIKTELILEEAKFENISQYNSCLLLPSQINDERNIIMNKWKEKGYEAIDKEFRKKYRMNILKYKIIHFIPRSMLKLLRKEKLKNEN